jgi:hypothetical protein
MYTQRGYSQQYETPKPLDIDTSTGVVSPTQTLDQGEQQSDQGEQQSGLIYSKKSKGYKLYLRPSYKKKNKVQQD